MREKIFSIRHMKLTIDIIVIMTTIFSIIYTTYSNTNNGYIYICLLPLTYLLVYFIIFKRLLFKKLKIFLTSFAGISYLRYTIMPIIIVLTQYYNGRSIVNPTEASYKAACLLMCYELIVTAVAILILDRKYSEKDILRDKNEIHFSKSNFIYYIFFAFTIIATVVVPNALNFFSIITPSMSGSEHLMTLSFKSAVVTYMLFITKHLIFALLLSFLYKKHLKSKTNFYKNLAFILTLINISIFYGLNRSDLVIPACASLLLYNKLFKDRNLLKYVVVAIVVIILITVIGNSRELYSISKNTNKLVDMADFFQGYLGGVYNVAISIETYDYYPEARNITRLAYDVFRPFIGFNIFLKNADIEFTNKYFNQRIYFSDHSAQIIPMIGQGYIHFGYILAPMLGVIVVWLAYKLEYILNKSCRIEIMYFLAICLIRMGFFMGQNTSNIINEISMNLVMFTMVYILNNYIVYKKRGNNDKENI